MMRSEAVLVLVIVMFGVSFQASASISVLSQEYSVSGWAVTETDLGPGPSDNFSYSSESASGISGFAESKSSWKAYAGASSISGTTFGASETYLYIHPHVDAWGSWGEGPAPDFDISWGTATAYADASAMLTFQPTNTSLPIIFSYKNYGQAPSSRRDSELRVLLTDLADEIPIYEKIMSVQSGMFFNFSESYMWDVNPSHVYSLEVSASANAYGAAAPGTVPPDDNCMEVSVTLPPIPAPSALILASIGVACVRGLHKRRIM